MRTIRRSRESSRPRIGADIREAIRPSVVCFCVGGFGGFVSGALRNPVHLSFISNFIYYSRSDLFI